MLAEKIDFPKGEAACYLLIGRAFASILFTRLRLSFFNWIAEMLFTQYPAQQKKSTPRLIKEKNL